ncbi:MAG: glucokinase [Rhodospirillales bacterium]|nr:glucokinase [Rhodospirillales bacterium]
MNDTKKQASTLIADIGGTNARFALSCEGRILGSVSVLACRDYPDLAAAAKAYLEGIPKSERPRDGVIAVAAPVAGDHVRLTNLQWEFSTDQLRRDLGLVSFAVVNDFTAIAWAVPHLTDAERRQVGGGEAHAKAPIAIIGPGSGLGVAALIPDGNGWTTLSTEGGHVTMAAATEEEERVLGALRRRFGHVSAERVLSGPGLVNIHTALAELDGELPASLSPEDVSTQAMTDPASRAGRAFALFCSFLGTAASNAALGYDARGGVYLAGGILGKLEGAFTASCFRDRFEAKGRFSPYLSRIPTFLIHHPFPALAGLAKGPLPPSGSERP